MIESNFLSRIMNYFSDFVTLNVLHINMYKCKSMYRASLVVERSSHDTFTLQPSVTEYTGD